MLDRGFLITDWRAHAGGRHSPQANFPYKLVQPSFPFCFIAAIGKAAFERFSELLSSRHIAVCVVRVFIVYI